MPSASTTGQPVGAPRPRGLRRYFVEETAATADEVAATLWNPAATAASFGGESPYRAALLEQYKLYVEMADRISARRGLANTFFLSLNTALLTAVGVFFNEQSDTAGGWLVLPLVALLAQCLTWYWIIRSYRQLNSAKWAVVGALEQRLPASPYWLAEWKAIGEGRDPARYWPLTHVEQWIPVLFALTYVAGFLALAVS